MASESDTGCIFLLAGQYVDPLILNEILEANNPFPCNTTGKMQAWTTNPDLQPKSEWESINHVSEEELKEWGFESLFDSCIIHISKFTQTTTPSTLFKEYSYN